MEDLVDQLDGAKHISTLDLTQRYWQVPVAQHATTPSHIMLFNAESAESMKIHENLQHQTAFATPFGLYQFRRMPFGLQGAAATFQRMMDRLLDGWCHFANAYLDDLVIFSSSWPEHLRAVCRRLKEAGLTVKSQSASLRWLSECTCDTLWGGG